MVLFDPEFCVFSEFLVVHPDLGAVPWHGRGLLSVCEGSTSCIVNVGSGFFGSGGGRGGPSSR